MAEIKVFCLHCGQHIQCDEGYRGVQINCPSCNQSFFVQAAQPIPPMPSSAANPPAKIALLIAAIVAGLIGVFFLGIGLFLLLPSQGTNIIGCIFFISISILALWNAANLYGGANGNEWHLIGPKLLIWPLAILLERSHPTPDREKTNWYLVAALILIPLIFLAAMVLIFH